MNRIRYGTFITALLLALVLSAFNTAPAFADEVTPPADETTSEEVVVDETEPTISEEEATPPDVSEVDSAPAEESATVAEVIEALPAETEVVVVNEAGETLPLASEEAAEVVYNGDPLWCPAGVAPKPGIGGCSPSFTSFNNDDTLTDAGLIAWLNDPANAIATSKAGVIWIAYNYEADGGENGSIVIDGTSVGGGGPTANMENFALTIQGGWNGTPGSTALNTTQPYSIINNPFLIYSWVGAVTVNNLYITSASGGTSALEVWTAGNITVNNVDIYQNTTQYGGAYLVNNGGTGNVTVNDSTFNNNTGVSAVGLDIPSNGTVTLKNVTANGNGASGIYINNEGASTPKAVNLNGSTQANYNAYNGVLIYSKGVITTNNITAMGNGNNGVYLDNCSYDNVNFDCNYGVANGVTIKGTNNFSNNGYDGLRVLSGGVITVNNITANGNGTNSTRPVATSDEFDAFGKGAYLFNAVAATPKNILISGTNTFNFNASNGLSAITNGMITVNNITASFNNCDTAKDTDPTWCAGALLLGNSGVTQTGYGRFEGNDDHADQNGLLVQINSGKGAITLNNLFAFDNGDFGVELEADGGTPALAINVTINGSNTFSNNGDSGLYIDTDGTVTLNNLTAEFNDTDGVFVSNAYLTKAVTLKGINNFNGNTVSGLRIVSFGAITTNAVSSTNNTNSYGVYLDNCGEVAGTCSASTVQPITLNGNNIIEANGFHGLRIDARGAITINNLTTNSNNNVGANINNMFTNAVGGITIKGYATAFGNGSDGLVAFSNGAISLINLTASANSGHGVYAGNNNSPTSQAVTVSGVNQFIANQQAGLFIQSFGAVTTNALTSLANQSYGVYIDNCDVSGLNCQSLSANPVTMNGNNFFENNADAGLYIESRGAVTVNNLTANFTGSGGDGVVINNGRDNAVGAVTIKGFVNASFNSSNGLQIVSNGAVTLANITASYNSNSGVDINNANSSATPMNVTITGTNTFNGNTATGLYIFTYGTVTLNNLTAGQNTSGGVSIDNSAGTLAKTVTLNGNNTFNANSGGDGLYINSLGAIKINNVIANYNSGVGSSGAQLSNNGAIENQPITITGFGIFNYNSDYGLYANSNGNITLANINADGNTNVGANISTENNATTPAVANVTITGINAFNYNSQSGLVIYADGAITVSNITANQNSGHGAYLNNVNFANGAVKNVTLSGVNMFSENNGSDGLYIEATGTVSLTRVTANVNTGGSTDGVSVVTQGAINLTCGSMNGNGQFGYNLTAGVGKVITIKGVLNFGNGFGNFSSNIPVITRACPLP